MGENQIIAATLKVDASSAVTASKSIADMKSNIKDLKAAFEDSKSGSAEQAEAFKKLTAAQDELSNSTANLNKTSEETSGRFKNIKEGIAGMGGPLGQATEGANTLNSTFLKLIANPVVLVITAIVGALTLMYKAFTNSFEGGEKMEQVFAGIKAAGQALLDSLGKIGSAIVKFFSFDFSGAIKDIKSVGDAAIDAYSKMSNLTKQAQELARESATNDLEQAQRQAKLADLRAKAYDDSVPIAKRKEALQELQKESEQNAKEDMDLAKRVADNKIAQLELEKDGEKKNFVEIQKIRADQVRNATENSNELKQIGRQISSADKAELAERKAAQAKAAEEAKKIREQNQAFQEQLTKLQHENALAGITDQYKKEKQILENKLADEQATLKKDLENKKITRAQYNQLEAAQLESAAIQRAGLEDKHQKDIADKEAAFQKALNAIKAKIQLDGITDTRQMEKVQLQLTYEQQLQDAMKVYKDDAVKFQKFKQALDDQLKAAQDKLDAKNKKEDAKKKLEEASKAAKNAASDPKSSFKEKQALLDADVAANEAAFKAKAVTEDEYLQHVKDNTEAQKNLHKAELESKLATVGLIGDALGSLSDLVGKQTAAGKAFAVASATIAAIESAVKSYNSLADIPIVGPALGAIAAAGAIAAGYANIKKIVSVQVPGQASGGTVPTAPPAMAAPIAPTQQSTSLNPGSINAIGNATSGRVYVLNGDVANARDRDERLNRAARLGGDN